MDLNIKKNLKSLSTILLFFFSSSLVFADEFFAPGDSLSFQLGVGKAINWQKLTTNISTQNQNTVSESLQSWQHENLLHLGLTYHYPIKEDYTLDAQLSWLLYPTLLDSSVRVLTPFSTEAFDPKILIFTPLTDLGISKKINDEISVGAGITYLWGIYAKSSYKIADQVSAFCHARWFADRYLFKNGLHDSHIVIGLSYEL